MVDILQISKGYLPENVNRNTHILSLGMSQSVLLSPSWLNYKANDTSISIQKWARSPKKVTENGRKALGFSNDHIPNDYTDGRLPSIYAGNKPVDVSMTSHHALPLYYRTIYIGTGRLGAVPSDNKIFFLGRDGGRGNRYRYHPEQIGYRVSAPAASRECAIYVNKPTSNP